MNKQEFKNKVNEILEEESDLFVQEMPDHLRGKCTSASEKYKIKFEIAFFPNSPPEEKWYYESFRGPGACGSSPKEAMEQEDILYDKLLDKETYD